MHLDSIAIQDFIAWTDRELFYVLKNDKSENWGKLGYHPLPLP